MVGLKENSNFYVITGGPGVGKTTLLKELSRRDFIVIPEIARDLIKEQQKIEGEALPWQNTELYKDLMFDRSIESYEQVDNRIEKGLPVFFDRGFLDAICYAVLIRSDISMKMKIYARNWRYSKRVFMLPPWREIYVSDNERKQNWEEAVLTYKEMKAIYKRWGYEVVEVPKKTDGERADFILEFIEKY